MGDSMSIVLQSSGGGSVTLNEPTTASNFTQTLPAANGNIITTGDSGTITQGMLATAASSIGVGQTWQNVSKFSGVTYTNSTGKPISVIVGCSLSSSTISLTVDGLVIQSMGNTAAGPGNVSAIVPNNSTYSVNAPSAVSWFELR
jgi:hypothetical protein